MRCWGWGWKDDKSMNKNFQISLTSFAFNRRFIQKVQLTIKFRPYIYNKVYE